VLGAPCSIRDIQIYIHLMLLPALPNITCLFVYMKGLTFYGLFSMRTHCWDEDLNYRFMAFNMDIRRGLFSFHDIHKGGRGERGLMSIARRRSGEAHQNLIFFGPHHV
jgi:hypothetical protein